MKKIHESLTTQERLFINTIVSVIIFLISIMLFNFGFEMVNAKDDLSNLIGVIIFVIGVFILGLSITKGVGVIRNFLNKDDDGEVNSD